MPLDRNRLKRYSIHERPSKVTPEDFAVECSPGKSFNEFLDGLPRFLQANQLRSLIDTVSEAVRNGKPILVLYGAHVVKTGLSPIFCQALSKGWITYAATNGAGTIHDLELARFGRTSEDVAEALEDGSFGMAIETGTEWNQAVNEGAEKGMGLGEAVGDWILSKGGPSTNQSILAAANDQGRPVTSHAAIGTDITHIHPESNGESIGSASYRDFELLCQRIPELNDGGVVINIGSAVILPEVFLKALSVARNLAGPVRNFTAANLDMNRHYRPSQNVLLRPTRSSGQALEVIGPHEILVPMLFQGVCEKLAQPKQ
ncbi:MAG: hypothetical protein KC978_03460 [Candidatus Omnitrophica bacterium]|nr:hypothetical protein [Candidatus Omnitrophota bacterium]